MLMRWHQGIIPQVHLEPVRQFDGQEKAASEQEGAPYPRGRIEYAKHQESQGNGIQQEQARPLQETQHGLQAHDVTEHQPGYGQCRGKQEDDEDGSHMIFHIYVWKFSIHVMIRD
jgi:hypothetical protein